MFHVYLFIEVDGKKASPALKAIEATEILAFIVVGPMLGTSVAKSTEQAAGEAHTTRHLNLDLQDLSLMYILYIKQYVFNVCVYLCV